MGIHDRDYYQDDPPQGIRMGGQLSMVGKLIALNVGIYFVDIFTGHQLMELLAAKPSSLSNPLYAWQLLTYGFGHDPQNVGHIFWNMFALFVFGRDVEGVYGGKEFLKVYLLTVFLGGLVWAGRNLATLPPDAGYSPILLGASGAITAVTLLFCLHFPKRTILLMFVLPIPAWVLGVMVIVINMMGLAAPNSQTAFDVHLVGAAFGLAYYYLGWNFSRFTFNTSGMTRRFKPKPKLKLHDPEKHYQDLDAEADALLEKVKQDGINSLTDKERATLEKYSRRMQQKHR